LSDPDQLRLEEFQGFTCTWCGLCCSRPWRVHVEPAVEAGIRSSALFAQKKREGYQPLQVAREGGLSATNRKSNGDCVFLGQDKGCGLHAEMGGAGKPIGCQIYPYRAVRTPGGTFFSQSWVCPPVVAGLDRNVEENRSHLAEILRRHPQAIEFGLEEGTPIALHAAAGISWQSYLSLESRLREAFQPARPVQSLLAMARALTGHRGDESPAEWPPLQLPPDLSFESELLGMYLAGVLAAVEEPPERRAGFAEMFESGRGVSSPRLGLSLPPWPLSSAPQACMEDASARYFRNALVGKWLLVPSVLSRLLSLSIGYAMLELYAEALRRSRRSDASGSPAQAELSLLDLTRAFELADGEISHNDALTPFFVDFEATLLKLDGH
jgi:Fe-S-cluster containining protein